MWVCVTQVVSENITQRQFATKVLNFMKFECDVNQLSIVSFERLQKNVNRMAYYYLSDKSETEKRLMISFQTLNTSDIEHNSSMKELITKRLYSNVMVITTFDNPENWAKYLQLMAKTKVKSSIITFVGRFNQTKWESFISIADNIKKNSLFYVAFQKSNNVFDVLMWYRILTLHGNNKSIVNQMEFDSNGRLIEEYDMKGSHILSITLSWAPYFSLLNCSDDGQDCKSEGYLTDVMNILGNMTNFTWESHSDIDGNWGTTVVSGPSNSSGTWDGVVGHVFNGSYQLSISAWVWTSPRHDMFDFIPVVNDRMVLALMKKAMGALTMFFTTKMGIPFNSIREVMRAYPDWRLLMRSGYEAYYTQYVESGDVDYIKFWDRVQEKPDENTFSSVGEAINKYNTEPVIIHDVEGAISTYDGDATEYLDVFEKGRTEWYGLIVTENSPLGPMLAHGAKKLHETGVFDYLKTRWLGRPDHCRPLLDVESSNMVLGLEHVSVVFSVFAGLLIISLMVFLAELYKKNQETNLMKGRNVNNKARKISVTSIDEENEFKAEKEDKTSTMSNIFNLIWNV